MAWVEGRLLPALDDLGYRITRIPNPLLDKRGNYYGKQGTTHEHRTVGDYRAWSYDASEWCYPSDPCRLCREMADA
ncbi:hypothetical protein [Kineococcus radiotolerans]|uniref:hypothetical protein n=1 Tax=Kineococcus radiotolerans TaxID=131568 RepID=UPI00003A4136|nr:hypothetical protein [Kineococcus radiotolerans]